MQVSVALSGCVRKEGRKEGRQAVKQAGRQEGRKEGDTACGCESARVESAQDMALWSWSGIFVCEALQWSSVPESTEPPSTEGDHP